MRALSILIIVFNAVAGFSQNQCADLFSLKNKSEKQSVESGILSHIDALVVEKLRIDNNRFENENQKKQAVETFKTSLFNIVKIDQKYLEIFKKTYSEKSIQYNINSKSKSKEKRDIENERKQILEKTKYLDPKEEFQIHHKSNVTSLIFSPNSKYVVSASEDGLAKIFDVLTGKEIFQIHRISPLESARFSFDSKYIVTISSFKKEVKIHEIATGKEVIQINVGSIHLKAAEFSPNGKYIVTAEWDGTVSVFDVLTGQVVSQIMHDGPVYSAVFSPDSKYVVTASQKGLAKFFEIQSGNIIFQIQHERWIRSVEFSFDGKMVATASDDGSVKIYDVTSGKEIEQFQFYRPAHAATFSSDGKHLLVAAGLENEKNSHNAVAIIYEISNRKVVLQATQYGNSLYSAKFSPDNKYVVTVSDTEIVKTFEVATSMEAFEIPNEGYGRSMAELSSDGEYFARSFRNKTTIYKLIKSAADLSK